ncbi:hypothetical protein [aff. Roholtiella sp. LEGE 12411]|uniref:hypothetical protein n=1 Tax=aff. Roholtiella sp. LEGE 12411 TaxID=1828822 RepID=UPI0030DDAB79
MPPSAYPLAFPKALASEAILPLEGLRLATYSGNRPFPKERIRGLLRSQFFVCRWF